MLVPVRSISFWCNAFVPRDIVGATALLSRGDHRGLTALSGSPCYLTDQRDFSNELNARSRMHSLAKIEITNSGAVMTQRHRCDEFKECDPISGDMIRRRQSSLSNMQFRLEAAHPIILIRMDCKYTDPLAPTAHAIGEIEYYGAIKIDPVARAIEIDFMVCLFPAFEGYAAINDRHPVILFRHSPAAGILSLRIPRGAHRRIRSRLVDRDGDGVFEATALEI
jgi:hypothetical protein